MWSIGPLFKPCPHNGIRVNVMNSRALLLVEMGFQAGSIPRPVLKSQDRSHVFGLSRNC